jgi:Icc-related predicted phosphoesterase
MDIVLESDPYYAISYLNAGPGGSGCRNETLPFFRGRVKGLPPSFPALVATADLQGRSDYGEGAETLVGVSVAEVIKEAHSLIGFPSPTDCLACLAGDFYTLPNATKRGGTGNVRLVWAAMSETCRAVCGVAGNHDTFTDSMEASAERPPGGCLDGNIIKLGEWRIGGVSGSVGRAESFISLQKKSGEDFAHLLNHVLQRKPDILILHAAPFIDRHHVGSQIVAECLIKSGFPGLVICGHCHWPQRLHKLGEATVLNVHEAVVTLTT